VINVGGRDIDGLKELGHKMETVSGSVKKLLIPWQPDSIYVSQTML
jgi:hypothetical protein